MLVKTLDGTSGAGSVLEDPLDDIGELSFHLLERERAADEDEYHEVDHEPSPSTLQARERGCCMTLTHQANSAIYGDPKLVARAVDNVVRNAIRYTTPGTDIDIRITDAPATVTIEVRDHGPGVPDDMLERIFEMFQQVDQTLDRSHGGLGLGLTLVQRLVELHGGRVQARSAGEGQGSEFIVRLPLAESPLKRVAEPPQSEKRSKSLPRHRVLVVDDVYASAKTLAMMLESINQQVTITHDGPTAIQQALAERPDIVFLDIAMPGMNGYDVARALRLKPELQSIKLVALTGYGNEEDRRRAIEAGFDHHLTKPASIDQLAHLLHGLPDGGLDRKPVLSAGRDD